MDFKIKALWGDDRLYVSLLILAVGLASFGLGRLSVSPAPGGAPAAVPLTVPAPPPPPPGSSAPPTADTPALGNAAEEVVASRSGQRYHYPWCPGANQIKEANRITFANAALAEAAGYTRAANCPQVR